MACVFKKGGNPFVNISLAIGRLFTTLFEAVNYCKVRRVNYFIIFSLYHINYCGIDIEYNTKDI